MSYDVRATTTKRRRRDMSYMQQGKKQTSTRRNACMFSQNTRILKTEQWQIGVNYSKDRQLQSWFFEKSKLISNILTLIR